MVNSLILKTNKSSLLILGVTALIGSRALFLFIQDPEGPNLLIVVGLAAVVDCLSWLVYMSAPLRNLNSESKRLLVTVLAQVAFLAVCLGLLTYVV